MPRGGHGLHWVPQPRPWRQQQSSKVRAGPVRGPIHMPSSPRWPQHTSRRSGVCSVNKTLISKEGGRDCPPRSHPTCGLWPGGITPTGLKVNRPRTKVALTRLALRELAVAAGEPGHPGWVTFAAVGAREVDAAARAASSRILALIHVYGAWGGEVITVQSGLWPLLLPTLIPWASPISSGLRHWRCVGLYSAGGVQAHR